DLVEVDDMVRHDEAEVHHRHQRLAAGQQPAVVEPAQEVGRFRHRAGVVIDEGCWLHEAMLALGRGRSRAFGRPALPPAEPASAAAKSLKSAPGRVNGKARRNSTQWNQTAPGSRAQTSPLRPEAVEDSPAPPPSL